MNLIDYILNLFRSPEPDVARHAGRGEQLGLGRAARIEERHGIVDARIAVDDEGHALGHGRSVPFRSGLRDATL